jgi:HSP90 family molecular chaperone
MAVDFSKILCNNPALPKFEGIGKKETPAAVFGLVVLAPQDDVDMEQLNAVKDWKGKSVRHTAWLSEDAQFRTKEEIANVFGIEQEGKTLGQLFNETINKQVLVKIKHRPSDDGTSMFAEVESLAAA